MELRRSNDDTHRYTDIRVIIRERLILVTMVEILYDIVIQKHSSFVYIGHLHSKEVEWLIVNIKQVDWGTYKEVWLTPSKTYYVLDSVVEMWVRHLSYGVLILVDRGRVNKFAEKYDG